ncbi:MAG: glutamate--tRNA ligase [Buchnera aphidicola (Periphyllus lyropictus)]|uniref:glutamate--tRNA ligase n=1 Tax=Buchnera aphidicola TaxID=9 RepID=UPI001EC57953|nr:glutamate--tRNA ligase [Buchnera aphidicola]NIH16755.1 glutamate--tRNA ligase [Buchnera aphidicola (Periphyllus lyropictus)]USS94656.1 glutamate--tRNA ligase [Buchnera aphidicola (Periphyllus lyropictus)]
MFIKTRFAPSPTGDLHFGNIRTAFYSWLYAKQNNGSFILRIEDTDISRSSDVFSKNIIKTLKWLNLDWNEGPYFQSKRINDYQKVINFMLKNDLAYKCYCNSEVLNTIKKNQILKGEKPKYDKRCRSIKKSFQSFNKYVVRFKNPISGKVSFNDLVRGKIVFNNSELDDLIIQRENGIPTYNFCVVIDDIYSNITHVIRGEDHINNTPRQINILSALNAKIPYYSHLSMILNTKRKVLSKRNNKINILEYKKLGYLPEAILNYVVRLGWSHGNQEIFSIKEMINLFNFKSITKSSSVFDEKKLLWLNKYYINNLKINTKNILKNFFKKKNINLKKGPSLDLIIKHFSPHCYTLNELFNSIFCFYKKLNINYNKKWINNGVTKNTVFILKNFYKELNKLLNWNMNNILKIIKKLSVILNISLKKIIFPIRIALIGSSYSISINKIIFFMGKKKSLKKIKRFLKYLKKFFIK